MKWLRSVYGRFNAINLSLRKRRIAMVPVNWIAATVLLMALAASGFSAVETSRQAQEPQAISLSRVFAAPLLINRHVELTGLFFPETHLTYPARVEGKYRPVEYTYVAMTEDDVTRVLLVRFEGDFGHGVPRHATIQGLLVQPDSKLRGFLNSRGGKLAGLPIEPRYYLLPGARPAPLWLFPLISGLLGVVLVLMIVSEFRYLRSRSRSSLKPGA